MGAEMYKNMAVKCFGAFGLLSAHLSLSLQSSILSFSSVKHLLKTIFQQSYSDPSFLFPHHLPRVLHCTALHSLSLSLSLRCQKEHQLECLTQKGTIFFASLPFREQKKVNLTEPRFFHSIFCLNFCWVITMINAANCLWCHGHFLILYSLQRLHHLPIPHCCRNCVLLIS